MKDLEFHVDRPSEATFVSHDFGEAAKLAISISCNNGEPVNIDVVAWSATAARRWSGDEGLASYHEDPDASVFERIVVRAESLGRIA